MGAVHSRPGRLWLQLDRADSTPLRRRLGQSAFPVAADGDDDRHVEDRGRLWAGCMDLVSSDGTSYSTPEAINAAVKEWGDVLSKLPRVDALFVPTGDPGDSPPGELMAMLEAQAKQLKRLHPKAQDLDFHAEFHGAAIQ